MIMAGINRARRVPGDRNRTNDAGFTLIEMLVVLTIMGLLAGIAITNLAHRPAFVTRGQVRAQLERAAARAREKAIASGAAASIDLGAVAPGDTIVFAPTLGDTHAAPLFYPDGSSNGGDIAASGVALARIDWMTGRISDAAR
jgi:prepilin-type N-terminal cleavage/methylation domain-containing protein